MNKKKDNGSVSSKEDEKSDDDVPVLAPNDEANELRDNIVGESEGSTIDSCIKKKEASQKFSICIKKPKKKSKMTINLAETKYDVVRYVGKKLLGWKVIRDIESKDWDVYWTDNAVQPENLSRMNIHQKINHFPGKIPGFYQ